MLEEREPGRAVATARPRDERELRLLRRGGLDKQEPVALEDRGQMLDQGVLQGRKPSIGRVDEDEIVSPGRPGVGAQSRERVLAEDGCAGEAELVEVAVDRPARVAVAFNEGG